MFGRRKTSSQPAESSVTERPPFLVAYRTEDRGMMVRLDPAQIESPGHAGIMVVDIMRHMARAMSQYGTAPTEDAAMGEMTRLVQAELEHPTDLGSGSIVN